MTLREEFESSGNWLFRWRSYVPLILIGIFLIALLDYEYLGNSVFLHHFWVFFCFMVSFFGLGIRIFTVGYTPKGTSGRNTETQVAETLNTTGIYSTVRNPLYLGNFFMVLGAALFVHLWWMTLIYILIFWLFYERVIFAEEAYLTEKFGTEYTDWANRTPVFIPNLSQYNKPNLSFSLKNILKREYNSFFAVVMVLFILESVSKIVIIGDFEVDNGWKIILSISFIIWISLRSLNKYSSILEVEGR